MFNLHLSTFCSNYLLITMTFERLYSIIKPHKAASFNTVKKARITIVFIIVGFTSYSAPLLFIGGTYGKFCVSNRFASETILGELYYWLTEIFSFLIPFISLLTMNSVIIYTLTQRSKQNILQSTGQTEGQNLKTKQSEKQIITMLLLITFVFLTLSVPTRALLFYLNFSRGSTPYYYAGYHLFYQVGEITYLTNHGINFFLYVMSGQKFKTDLRNLFMSKKTAKNESFGSGTGTKSHSFSSSIDK